MRAHAHGRGALCLALAVPLLAGACEGVSVNPPADHAAVTVIPIGGPAAAGTPVSALPGAFATADAAGKGTSSPAESDSGSPLATPEPAARVPSTGPPLIDPAIVALLSQVDPVRLKNDVVVLAGFGTRHALSAESEPDRGVGAARDWIHRRFEFLSRPESPVVPEFEDFQLSFAGHRSVQRNVIATLAGRDRPKRFVYVGAHYDSRAEDVEDGGSAAPGADSNASGVAALLEMARVLSAEDWSAGIRFLAFAAKEPGLKGSAHHAEQAKRAGLPILAMINLDTIGAPAGDTNTTQGGEPGTPAARSVTHGVAVLSAEGRDDSSRRLARYVLAIADRYADRSALLGPDDERHGAGSDHQPFDDEAYPAVWLTEALEPSAVLNTQEDTPDRVDADYLAAVTRLAMAVAANLAKAPPAVAEAPEVKALPEGVPGSSGPRVAVTWPAVLHPAVAGYWLVTRRGEDPAYTGWTWVGSPAGPGGAVSGAPGLSVLQEAEPVRYILDPGPGGLDALRISVASTNSEGDFSLFSPEAEP